jgi:hypothetical protein
MARDRSASLGLLYGLLLLIVLLTACPGPGATPPTGRSLSVSVTGEGTVGSVPAGIACPGDCAETYDEGAQVTLTATPLAGATFDGWGGACSGNGPSCVVTMNGHHQVTAAFRSPDNPGGLEPNSVQGQAVDTQGRPIAGAKVWINPAVTWGAVVEVRTDASGRYRVTGLPTQPYYAQAWIDVDYGGERYCLRLGMPRPADYDAFTPEHGVVRDFEWQLTGVIEDLRDLDAHFGGEVLVFPYNLTGGTTELTFTPTAPLVDGSTIQPFTRSLTLTRDTMVYDIPLGLYEVTAVLVEESGTRTPLKIGTQYSDSIQTDSVALTFASVGYCSNSSGISRSYLYVAKP